MACTINDGFISTIDYSVNFNLHSRVITVTDLSTGTDLGDITSYIVTIGFPTGSSTNISVTVGGTGTGTIPSVGGVVAIGLYTISAAVTDSVDTYTCVKPSQNICKPFQCDTTVKNSDGCLVPSVTFRCNDNYMLYVDRTDYTYQSVRASTITYDVYAVDADLTVIANHVNVSTFTDSPIVNGRYVFTISNTAVYDFGNGITVSVVYAVSNKQYFAACNVNLCDAKCAIEDVYAQYQLVKGSGSTQAVQLANQLAQLNSLFMIATLQQSCGDDGLSDTILEIEKVAGVKCSCGCGTATSSLPLCCDQTIVITSPDDSITINQVTAGDTTTFQLSVNADEVVNLYTSNGTLQGNREVDQNNLTLSFINTNEFSIEKGVQFFTITNNATTGFLFDMYSEHHTLDDNCDFTMDSQNFLITKNDDSAGLIKTINLSNGSNYWNNQNGTKSTIAQLDIDSWFLGTVISGTPKEDISATTVAGMILRSQVNISLTSPTITTTGKTGLGVAASTAAWAKLAASTTSVAQLNLATGSAPSAPNDGDIWLESNTNTGLKIRINGVTKTITLS